MTQVRVVYMVRRIYLFDAPERFVAGTVGQPGQRTFFLQAREGRRLVSIALEKQQVALLADKVEELLDEARRRGSEIPMATATGSEDLAPLDAPIDEEFRVGTLGLAWLPDDDVVVIEARAADERFEQVDETLTDEDADGPDVLRVRLTPRMARAFARRASRVVAAGRPPCPHCGMPLDPEDHFCPRMN